MKPVRLGELCAATSLFTDLGTGQPVEHGLRTCLVAMRLADALDVDPASRQETFYVSLLRFLGCTADSFQVAALFNDDDLAFFSEMAPVTMGSALEELTGVARTAKRMLGLPAGLGAVLRALSDLDGKERLLDAHCEVASRLADDMGLPLNVSSALDKAYARWDGAGVPPGVGGEEIPISIRLSVVARDLELLVREFGAKQAAETLSKRSERAYDPTVVGAALELGVAPLRACDGDLWATVTESEPYPWIELPSSESLGRALRALGDFADLKSPELTGHSRRVERTVSAAAAAAGLSGSDRITLSFAGSVHDVGVVAAPARVWRTSHPGPADVERARLHPMWSERILKRVQGLEPVGEVSGRHHERLDGSGYPSGTTGFIGRGAGLLACAELYVESLRDGGRADDAVDEMRRLAGNGALAANDVAATLAAVGVESPLIELERPGGLTEREVDVLRLVASGSTNKEIARQLGISAKTVGSHVEHIYSKAGVRTRAGATLFAVQNDLVE